MKKLTADYVRSILGYDPETGVFKWKARLGNTRSVASWNGKNAGKPAGTPKVNGYLQISIDGKRYYAHRLAWLLAHGEWPASQIDHANGLPSDNRLSNLRSCTPLENQQNTARRANTRSGLTGVYRYSQNGKWRAQIVVSGKAHRLGLFDTPNAAHAAYVAAKGRMHWFQPMPRDLSEPCSYQKSE